MARRVYSGRGLMARWYMGGWDPARRARISKQAVRIYRLSATEYIAFILDALNRKSDDKPFAGKPYEGNIPEIRRKNPLETDEHDDSAAKEGAPFAIAAE